MFGFKNLIAIFIIACSSPSIHGAVEVLSKFETFDEGIFFYNRESFNDGILVYAICDSNANNVTNCKIVQENYPYDEAAYSCLVTLENNHLRGDGDLYITVAALGKDKAVLYWRYRYSDENHSIIVKIGTVNLKTCAMNSVRVPDATVLMYLMHLSHSKTFVTYSDDSFDVFYPDPKHRPEDGELYKIQIDGNGELISEPKSANVERGYYFEVLTVATRSPAKGYAFVKRRQYKSRKEFLQPPILHLLLVKPDGTTKNLAEYKRNTLGAVAAGNNFISLCQKSKDKGHIVCTQYDEYGNVEFTTTLATKNTDIDIIKSFNLPNGGMLVMYGSTKYQQKRGIRKRAGYEVVWIDSDGKKKGKIFTRKSEIPKGMIGTPYIYANGDKGYCATVIMEDDFSVEKDRDEIPVNFKIVANCFTENDLIS